MRRPNILYIHSHDTGRYVQPYGHGVATANLQRLAEQGVLFRQAFSMAPICTPSRVALLTGQSPHSAGMVGLAHRGFPMNDYRQHILHTLRQAGYHSALVGVQHIARDRKDIGYDELVELPEYKEASDTAALMEYLNCYAEAVAPAAAGWLGRVHRRPFFLSVGFYETHRPFPEPGRQNDPRFCLPPAPVADCPETRRDMAGFREMAGRFDAGVGEVLEALDRCGLGDETLVISTTDHGISFPKMKANLTDHGIGVALIVRGPGGFEGGKVVDAMISQVDVFPTLCELLEIDAPAWLAGRSFLPVIRGDVEQINEEVFAEVTYHGAYEPQRAVRTRRWKYIRRFGRRARPVLANIEDGPTKDLWIQQGWGERALEAEELYDLLFDPCEANNLAAQPACREALAEMRKRLEAWMQRTDDPLLRGPVAAPPGARYNSQDAVSPSEPLISAS